MLSVDVVIVSSVLENRDWVEGLLSVYCEIKGPLSMSMMYLFSLDVNEKLAFSLIPKVAPPFIGELQDQRSGHIEREEDEKEESFKEFHSFLM